MAQCETNEWHHWQTQGWKLQHSYKRFIHLWSAKYKHWQHILYTVYILLSSLTQTVELFYNTRKKLCPFLALWPLTHESEWCFVLHKVTFSMEEMEYDYSLFVKQMSYDFITNFTFCFVSKMHFHYKCLLLLVMEPVLKIMQLIHWKEREKSNNLFVAFHLCKSSTQFSRGEKQSNWKRLASPLFLVFPIHFPHES